MSTTSADFDRVCAGDVVRLDYGSPLMPNLEQDESPWLPRGVDQAALRQSYAYAWAQTLGSEYGSSGHNHSPAMYVLSAPSLSVELAQLSSRTVSCWGYVPSKDGKYLVETLSSRTETYELSSTEVSSLQHSCDWRTMKYGDSQDAWCLLNTPGFTKFDGSYSGTNLKNTLDAVLRLHDRAAKDPTGVSRRFFLSKESNEWLKNLDGTLLSTIQTSSSLDLDAGALFGNLVAPHVSAADFSPLSNVLSDSTFLDFDPVSAMYGPLAALDETSLLMAPWNRLLAGRLMCAGHWDETEKNTDVSGEYKTSADFINYVNEGTGYSGFYPGCPQAFFKKRIHMGYERDEDGEKKKALWRDIERTSEANCQLCAYVKTLSAGYDNGPAVSALDFRDNEWMRQRKTQGVVGQKLLVMTASVKRQTWSDLSGYDRSMMTADVYADLVDTETAAVRLSAYAQDAVTGEDERCMLADIASTLPHEERVQLGRRIRDFQVDMPLSSVLWREDSWSRLGSPSPIWDLLVARQPSLPSLKPVAEYGDSSAEAFTMLVGCWSVTEVDSPLKGLVP